MAGRPRKRLKEKTDFHPSGNIRRTKGLEDRVLARIANGETVKQIARDEDMPAQNTILYWVQSDENFKKRYDLAREIQVDIMFDEILEIVDDGTNDWIEREKAGGRITKEVDKEHINRSRLRFEARKWYLSKMMPNKYGEKVQAEVTGRDGKDLVPEDQMSSDRLLSLAHTLAFTLAAGARSKSESGQTPTEIPAEFTTLEKST